MKDRLTICSDLYPTVFLRAIEERDQSNLRAWKNENRRFFFYQEIISEAMQREWFSKYQQRDQDYMFIVSAEGTDIGCMGVRLLEGTWDIYNVILGNVRFAKKGYMRQSFHLLCSFALAVNPVRISAQVLNDNPALSWYCRNGFVVVARHSDHVEIELDKSRFVSCSVVQN